MYINFEGEVWDGNQDVTEATKFARGELFNFSYLKDF